MARPVAQAVAFGSASRLCCSDSVLVWRAQPPDLLVARDGLTAALRTSDGALKLFRPAKDKYSAAEWLKRDGDARTLDDAVAGRADGVSCDAYGCIARKAGFVIADVARIDALAEDCATATIVILATPSPQKCVGPKLVIDDATKAGGYAVWLGAPLRVETVAHDRGAPPVEQAASVAADQSHQLALNPHPVGAVEPRLIGRVRRFERDGIAAPPEPLQRCFLVIDQRDHDLAGVGAVDLLDDHRVAVEDAGVDHRGRPSPSSA